VAPALQPPAASAAVALYAGPLADAIRRFKYAGRTDLAPALAALLVECAPLYGGAVDAVLPVPLHPSRLRQRGFNPAALLSRPLARALGARLLLSSVRRVRPTPAQAGLPRSQRKDNVRGAFEIAGPLGDRILVVDDVRTTGATLAELALTLREGGVREVSTLALARAPG